jgi:hypothetical protein
MHVQRAYMLLYVCYVQIYPGATHNRFEHSIGVGHLASEQQSATSCKQLPAPATTACKACMTQGSGYYMQQQNERASVL